MMAAVMGRWKNILATEGNLNNLIGLPQTIFRLRPEYQTGHSGAGDEYTR